MWSIPQALAQLERLGEVARGHPHLVAVRAQPLDHRAHDEHVRAVREVDPDAHAERTVTTRRAIWQRARRYRCPPMLVLASISETLVNETSHFVREAGLPGIFALMAISSACIPIPSEVVMLFAGFAVADPGQSGAQHHLTLVGVVLAGLLGTMVGSWVAYGVGRGGRLELLERHGAKLHMGPAQIERADRWFQRYGEAAVLFGRVIPLVRAFVSLPAGIARMPLGRFTVFSLIGSIPWVLGLALAGHALGGDWKSVRKGFEYVDYAILALVVVGIVYASCAGAGDAATAGDRMPPAEPSASRSATPSRSACCRARRAAADLLLGAHDADPVARGLALRRARRRAAQVLRGRPARGRRRWRWRSTCAASCVAPARELGRGGRAGLIALSLPPPALVGATRWGGRSSAGWAGRARSPSGLLAGAAAMRARRPRRAAADGATGRCARTSGARATGWRSGSPRPCALIPGVSRNGATLTAARARGFAREDAQALSWHARAAGDPRRERARRALALRAAGAPRARPGARRRAAARRLPLDARERTAAAPGAGCRRRRRSAAALLPSTAVALAALVLRRLRRAQ